MAPRPHSAALPQVVEVFQIDVTSESGASFPSLARLQIHEMECDPAYDTRNGDQSATFDISRSGVEAKNIPRWFLIQDSITPL